MREDLMFRVMAFLSKLGFRVRTEQMLGLPHGATSEETKTGIDLDLETLELNVKLREETGLPTMAWASIFAPYKGTRIYDYCLKHGFYSGYGEDIPTTFFESSVLKFPRKWIGPSLSPENKDAWMDEKELNDYRTKLQMLRDLFTYFAVVPAGHKLAKRFLNNPDTSYHSLSTDTRRHLYDTTLYEVD